MISECTQQKSLYIKSRTRKVTREVKSKQCSTRNWSGENFTKKKHVCNNCFKLCSRAFIKWAQDIPSINILLNRISMNSGQSQVDLCAEDCLLHLKMRPSDSTLQTITSALYTIKNLKISKQL